MTRLRRSRPRASVPSKCALDGPEFALATLIAVGLCGAIRGAARATTTMRTIQVSPIIADPLCTNRDRSRRIGVGAAATSGAVATRAVAAVIRAAPWD